MVQEKIYGNAHNVWRTFVNAPFKKQFSIKGCVFITTLLSMVADAQTQADDGQKEEIIETKVVVSGEQSAASVSSISKIPVKQKAHPQSVTVINREMLEQQNQFQLSDVMEHATGVVVRPYIELTTAYYVRGFRVDSFELDGVPMVIGNEASPSQDLSTYERMEILRGSNGLFHGTGNPAATVNFVRKRPSDVFKGNTTLSVGSWDTYRIEADVGGPLNKAATLRGRIVTTYDDRTFSNGFANQKNRLIYGLTEFDLTPTTLLTLGAQYQEIDSRPDMAGVPMTKEGKSLGLSRKTYLNNGWSRLDWRVKRLFGSVDQTLPNDWKLKISGEYQTVGTFLKYGASAGAVDPLTGEGGWLNGAVYKFNDYSRSFDVQVQGPVTFLGHTHQILFGASYGANNHSVKVASLEPDLYIPINVYSWNPMSIPEPGISEYINGGIDKTIQKGVYGMGRFKLAEPVTLIVGGRVSAWQQQRDEDSYKPKSQLTPYGGLIWDFSKNWSWYASFAEIFQPQTRLTWDRSILDPVKGRTYETGIKGELMGGLLNLSLAAFRINLDNNVQLDADHPCDSRYCYYINGGKVQSQGVEFESIGHITPHWNIRAGYTYNTTKYRKDSTRTGEYASFNPRYMLRLWTHYELPFHGRRWSLGIGTQTQSEYSVGNRIKLRQGGYTLANLRLAYRVDEHWSAALNVNNVFDKTYYSGLFSPHWSNRYGNRRNMALTLRANF